MGCNCNSGEADRNDFLGNELESGIPILGYWNCQARGDPCRMLLHNLGILFTDKMYDFDDQTDQSWGNSRNKLGMTIPNLPYWKDGDIVHSETLSIMRSICRKYCPLYLGRTEIEQAFCDSFANTLYGGFQPWIGPYMFMPDYADKMAEGIEAARNYLG